MDPLERAPRAVEDEIADLGYEVLAAFTTRGAELFRISGGRSRVVVPLAHREAIHGAAVIHNHPSGASFSLRGEFTNERGDVEFAAAYRLVQIRVVTANQRFVMEPGPDGWSEEIYRERLMPVIDRIDEELGVELTGEVVRRQNTDFPLFHDYLHELWLRVAAATGLQYRREPRR